MSWRVHPLGAESVGALQAQWVFFCRNLTSREGDWVSSVFALKTC